MKELRVACFGLRAENLYFIHICSEQLLFNFIILSSIKYLASGIVLIYIDNQRLTTDS